MYEHAFDQMYCIQSTDHYYRLVASYLDRSSSISIQSLSEEAKRNITKNIAFSIGQLVRSCNDCSIAVNQVEIILPPQGEYLDLQNRLKDVLIDEGIEFTISVGVRIIIPNTKFKKNIDKIEEQLKNFAQKDFGNN
jgi:hypothetical protein